MTEKQSFKKVQETLKHFQEWEQRNADFLLEKQKSGELELPDIVLETVLQFTKKDYLKRRGVLSEVFLCYLDYKKEKTKDERKSTDGTIEKYKRYAYIIAKIKPEDLYIYSDDDCIEHESLNILSQQNTDCIKRFNDVYNSQMLLEDSGKNILYCAPWRKWLLWNDCCWEKDQVNGIYQLASDAIERMYKKALDMKGSEDTIAMMEHARRSQNMIKIEAMVKTATWDKEIRIKPEDLDKDNMIFNCKNGSIDLRSGRLHKHDRSQRITMLSPVAYDDKAECPQWKNFLKSIFKKNKPLILFAQKILGMCLTGDVSEQAMFILYGAGANGKSTFINTIMKIMGDYGANTPTETFMQKRKDSANNDIARLKGTRFVSAMEGDYGQKLAEAVVKRLTGNDKISARFLYGEYFDFIPTFKIFMATNHKPKISGMDNAIWRRIKLIPFEVSFTTKQQDLKLGNKLEAELPGILAWMVEGCLRWQKEGLGEPPEIMDATKEYRFEMSAIETFLQENCRRENNGMIKAGLLYNAYKLWAELNNEHIISMRSFGMRLSETGMDKTRLSTGYHWLGISLGIEESE